jgi:two-component system, chemotaxis family, chemotaxis protein CheY
MRILIVDDNYASRRLLKAFLSEYGPCTYATNGLEAIEAFKLSRKNQEPFDLICLDIMMPEMDGREALSEIRKIEQEENLDSTQGVKIIMTTALDGKHEIIESFNEGCEGYIIKPVEESQLQKVLFQLGLIDHKLS